MDTTVATALWFLPLTVPICLWVAWSDLSSMKIPNKANMALLGVFVVLGIFALPFDAYLWRYLHLAVALVAGMALNAAGVFGAGDAKFIAAAAPMVALGDIGSVAFILGGALLVCFVLHRAARLTAFRRMTPDWKSWTETRRFPMGFPLAVTLVLYLVLAATQG